MLTNLRFAPDILRRLGEELVPHPDLGLVELVRNAYDADATVCTVRLLDVGEAGGTVVVEDDGVGMSAEDIRDGWLLLGRSAKAEQRYSPSGRRRVGEKGLGRLAALRLGRRVQMTSRTEAGPMDEEPGGTGSRIAIDWDAFDDASAVEDVSLSISTHEATEPRGTSIRIEDLRQYFAARDVRRLARSLVLLTGPFPSANTFRAVLDAPEFREMQRLVDEAYFTEHEYRIEADVTDGTATARLIDWRGNVLATADHATMTRPRGRRSSTPPTGTYRSPDARFELWTFNLSKEGFDVRSSTGTVRVVQDWLKVVGGVHLFQRGLRVHPYGDRGHDWLGVDLRRVRDPQVRPGTNTAVGRMVVDDRDDLLTPKTDRTGFIEDDAFNELTRFGQDVLDWAADKRLRLRDQARTERKDNADRDVDRATQKVTEAVAALPEDVRPPVRRAVENYQKAFTQQLRTVEDELQLYRSLASVGTTTAVFAHETLRPVGTLEQMAGSLERRVAEDLPESFPYRYQRPFALLLGAAASLRTFAEVPLRMLQRSKRRPGVVDLDVVVRETLDLFAPYLEEAGVKVVPETGTKRALVTTTTAAMESVLANLLSNAAHFFTEHDGAREVRIRTSVADDVVRLTFADSGPGIRTLTAEEVLLPGRTTRESGTGLGLTIIRDIVRDLAGTVQVIPTGSLGGAEFIMTLPRAPKPTTTRADR